jgi:hypothetical protein
MYFVPSPGGTVLPDCIPHFNGSTANYMFMSTPIVSGIHGRTVIILLDLLARGHMFCARGDVTSYPGIIERVSNHVMGYITNQWRS